MFATCSPIIHVCFIRTIRVQVANLNPQEDFIFKSFSTNYSTPCLSCSLFLKFLVQFSKLNQQRHFFIVMVGAAHPTCSLPELTSSHSFSNPPTFSDPPNSHQMYFYFFLYKFSIFPQDMQVMEHRYRF